MSINATKWVRDLRGVNASKKAILFCLADHADKFGKNCYPGLELISLESGLSRRAVISNIKEMESSGLIEKIGRPGEGGGRKSNLYHLPIDVRQPHTAGKRQSADDVGQSAASSLRMQSAHGAGQSAHGVGQCAGDAPEPSDITTSKNHQIYKAPKKKKGSRFCPESFQPSQQQIDKLSEKHPQLNLDECLQEMKNHEYRHPKTDWSRAFNTWCANAAKWSGKNPKTKASGVISAMQEFVNG